MNIKLLRHHLNTCSDGMSKANEDTEKQNQAMQDFIIWIIGYLDGIEECEGRILKYDIKLSSSDLTTPPTKP